MWRIFRLLILLFPLPLLFWSASVPPAEDWGFFAHRLINRMAVYTLPPEMMIVYKRNIDFIAEHAVDPDKRRYASPFEAMRHYIDLEPWGSPPFEELPRNWLEAVMKHTDLQWLDAYGDTLTLRGEQVYDQYLNGQVMALRSNTYELNTTSDDIRQFYRETVLPNFYSEDWEIPCNSLQNIFHEFDLTCQKIKVVDSLTQHGILPYHLVSAQSGLTQAFMQKDLTKILRLSAELGHYIGDAHVPLHTTLNYNGQLTNQVGIHAFWESRIPELFAEDQYDFLVGKPSYISDPVNHYWNIVLTSHSFVDSVLSIERSLSASFPSDRQFCFDERLDVTVRTQCREYAQAYQNRMSGMVESRMQASIHAIASAWYTAWIDAGQPDFGYEDIAIEEIRVDFTESLPDKKGTKNRRRVHE